MKIFLKIVLTLLLGFTLTIVNTYHALAVKKIGPQPTKTIQVTNNDGDTILYGSILNPREDELNIPMYSLLAALKKGDLSNLSIILTNIYNSTTTYSVPRDAISIQKKKINKKVNKYLVVNLFNLKTPSGVTVPPSALPNGNYKLRFVGKDIDLSTDAINYQTPSLVVGTVISKKSGLVSVEDLDGNVVSDKIVATSLINGTFFTEVRANKIKPSVAARKFLRERNKIKNKDTKQEENNSNKGNNEEDLNNFSGGNQGDEENISNNGEVEINTGVVHVVTDKDLFAITPLENDPDINALKADKPLVINDASTLTANLAREGNETLAAKIAKEQLEDLESEKQQEEGDIGCELEQFAEDCTSEDEDALAFVGEEFRDFIKDTTCNFPEYGLLKEFILSSPIDTNVFIGKGYCNFFGEGSDENKVCDSYIEVLGDFKSGIISQLPCPPDFCKKKSKVLENIKPPRCVEPKDFCEGETGLESSDIGFNSFQVCHGSSCVQSNIEQCIHKPVIDPYCASIGIDISSDDCKAITTDYGSGYQTSWVVGTSSKGNQFCVPENLKVTNYSYGTTDIYPQSAQDTIENCELNSCHKQCKEKFGTNSFVNYTPASARTCDVCDCEIGCDVQAGKYTECSDKSKYFSFKCCSNVRPNISYYIQPLTSNLFKGPVPLIGTGECLCQDPNNFDQNGIVKAGAQNFCKSNCPQGYELSPSGQNCFPICDQGLVRDQNGFCKRKCPQGFIDDGYGSCKCPEGQSLNASGKCETNSCPDYCKNTNYTFSPYYSTPLECQRCIGGGGPGSCGPNSRYDPVSRQCVSTTSCGVDQYADSTGVCRCNSDGSVATSLGPEGCKKQNYNCGSNMLPNNVPGEAGCICPSGLPYWDNNTNSCVVICSNGNPPANTSINLPPKSPIPCSNSSTTCPPATPIKCSDGSCKLTQAECTNTNICPPPYIKDPAFPNQCTCPTPTPYELGTTCVSTCPAGLTASTRPGGSYSSTALVCKCSDGSYPTTDGKCSSSTSCPSATPYKCGDGTCAVSVASCPCPSSTPYKCSDGSCAASAANCSSTVTCPAPYIKDPANSSYCTCPSSTPVAHYSSCLTTCPTGLVATTQPGTMKCPTCSSYQVCLCPDGSYPNSSGTCSSTQSSLTLNSAVLSSANLSVTFSASLPNDGSCAYLRDANNVTLYSLYCGSTTGTTVNAPVSTFPHSVIAGDQVKICKSNNLSLCSSTVAITSSSISTTPTAPGSLTATLSTSGTGSVLLTWTDNSNNETGFSIYRRLSGSTTWTLVTNSVTSGTTSYTDSNLTIGTYEYHVNACNSYGCSVDSNIVSVSVTSSTTASIPNPPTNLVATSPSQGTVNLTWTDNSNNETFFAIYRKLPAVSTATNTTTVTSNITTKTDSNLDAGTYEYRVTACNNYGCSADSNIATITLAAQRITLNTATVNSDTITYNFTKDNSDCLNLYTSGGTLLNIPSYCHGGASGAGYPLSTLNNNLQSSISVKLCYNLDPSVCSNVITLGGSFTTHTCAPNEAYSSTNICNCASAASPNLQNICACSGSNIYTTSGCQLPQVTLNSVVINQTNSTVSVNYSKNFNDCVTLKYSNSNTQAHTGDLFCVNNAPVTVPLSTFDGTKFQNSVNVKLCNASGTCSSIIQVSGPNICVPGQSTTSSTCSCYSPSGPDPTDSYRRCACPQGSVYTNSNGASFCRRYCNVGEANYGLPNDQCSCGVYGSATSSSACTCSNGNTYNSTTACGADSHI